MRGGKISFKESEKLLRRIFRHDIGTPLNVLGSITEGDPLGLLDDSDISEEEIEEVQELVDEMDKAYKRLHNEEPLQDIEEDIEMFAEYQGVYDGEIGDKVDEVAVLSTAVSRYLSEYESIEDGSVSIGEVLDPFEDYVTEIDYNENKNAEVEGDPGLFFVTNTVGMNGIEHGKEGQNYQMWAEVQELPENYRIDIWDNGSGVPERFEKGEIFEDGEGEGTGKGLYLANEIVELFDGEMKQSEKLEEREDGFGLELYLKKA